MKRRVVAAFATLALLAFAAADAVGGSDAASDRVDLGAPEAEVAAQRSRWEARFSAARTALVDAHLRYVEAQSAYRHMRHRDRERGEEKVQVMQELEAAKAAVAEAESAVEDLMVAARRAGVPPGWYPDRTQTPAAPRGADGGY